MIKYDFNLKGKVAVITGGGGALSGVFAEALCSHGAKVALFDINKEAADKAAAKLEAAGGIAKGYKADVLSKESITEAYEEVKKDFGTCDILLNGAGVHHPLATTEHEQITEENMNDGSRSFFDLDIEKVEWVNRLDFIGTFIPSQVICKNMIGKSGCSVINISSMNAISPTTIVPIYSAAKAGVSNFTAWLANYFALVGIRVNALAPGFFVTNLNKNIMYKEDGTLSGRSERIIAGTPMSRFGNPEECAGTLLYLVDPELSGFVTGAVIPIDGGFSSFCGV
ncbi:SDR family oxidoreductase [Clostridium sp. cel8]|uniref:SDR family oxidoreductase n=1 Tax=Clostridium sp. cel8 TaxID=2663123 RepID=UPI0015F3A9E8|nr:SDR family oxidoreductase [Clostridium sp. cel8]MBA5850740.1 SDR family oxidoreductase [Clostridium sp. cel8]